MVLAMFIPLCHRALSLFFCPPSFPPHSSSLISRSRAVLVVFVVVVVVVVVMVLVLLLVICCTCGDGGVGDVHTALSPRSLSLFPPPLLPSAQL